MMGLDHGVPWTHAEKGGRYMVCDVVTGAGSLHGEPVVLYAGADSENGIVYARPYREFMQKMVPVPKEGRGGLSTGPD